MAGLEVCGAGGLGVAGALSSGELAKKAQEAQEGADGTWRHAWHVSQVSEYQPCYCKAPPHGRGRAGSPWRRLPLGLPRGLRGALGTRKGPKVCLAASWTRRWPVLNEVEMPRLERKVSEGSGRTEHECRFVT